MTAQWNLKYIKLKSVNYHNLHSYAEADAVKFFGKEFFEEQPMDIMLGSWQVVFASEDQADYDNLPDFIFA